MKLRVAVICGGRSGEHEVSLRSAEAVIRGLDPARYEVQRIFIDPHGKWHPGPLLPEPGAHRSIDVVFPVLHGPFGEDGTVQGLLELADLPYVGAGVLGSAVGMDKEMMKRVCAERLLPVVDYVTVTRAHPDIGRHYLDNVIGQVLPMAQALIERGIASGEFRSIDARLAVKSLIAPMLLAALWRSVFEPIGAEPLDAEALAAQHADLIIRGLSANG